MVLIQVSKETSATKLGKQRAFAQADALPLSYLPVKVGRGGVEPPALGVSM